MVSTPSALNPLDYGCVGDGVTDDTTNLNACLAAAAQNGTVILPWGKKFKYTGTLTVPPGCVLQGSRGISSVGSVFYPNLIGGAAASLITLGSLSTMRDVLIDCTSTAYLGIYIGNYNHPSLYNVEVLNAKQAGFVLDATQNSELVGCVAKNCGTQSNPTGWPAVAGFLLNNGVQDCNFYNCCTDGYSQTNTNNRAWLITNITADPRFSSSVFAGGNRDNHWWGGIFEYGTPDYRIQITHGGGFDANGTHTFHDTQICGSCNTALVGVGTAYTGYVVFDNAEFVPNANTVPAVSASSGKIRYHGSTRMYASYLGLRDGTSLSGTASLSMDETTRQLLADADRRFDTGIGGWTSGTATASWDSTTKRLAVSGAASTNNVNVYFTGPAGGNGNTTHGSYSQQYRLVRVRLWVNITAGTFKLQRALNASPYAVDIGSLVQGINDFIYEISGTLDVGLKITQVSAGVATCEIGFVDAEHIAC